jgi:hypothetical protein
VVSRRLLIASVALLAGCQAKTIPYTATLITEACAVPAPLDGVTEFQFRISGEGLEPMISNAPVNAHAQTLPDIPPGKNRVLEVRGYAGDPDRGGKVVSVGRSLPFEVPSAPPPGEAPATLRVVLRRVNVFTPPNRVSSPGECTQMTEPRAGQTATLLSDGRVYIAGGWSVDPNGQPQSLASAELYDPTTGAFQAAPGIGSTNAQGVFIASPRAFHTATRLPGDQILLAGGETEGAAFSVLGSALVYDPVTEIYGALSLSRARTHATAAADAEGRVLIAGGVDAAGAPVESPEWYDPTSGTSRAITVALPRMGAAAVSLADGESLAVLGGSDGHQLVPQIAFFRFDGEGLAPESSTLTLREPRRDAAATTLPDGTALLAGGFADGDLAQLTRAISSTERIQGPPTPDDASGPTVGARGAPCAVALAKGQVLVAGGRELTLAGEAQASAGAELITSTPDGGATSLGMPPLPAPRWQHTCTPLADGSVLILGGLDDADGNREVLQDAVIFMPTPLD